MARRSEIRKETELEIGRAGLLSRMEDIGSAFPSDSFTNTREIILFRYPQK
jgi:hypothetical protein